MTSSFIQAKDFQSDAEIRWCPGCGDYIILKQLQIALAKSGAIPSQTAVISGIGCSSRMPYYMNTFGFHTIHGRALAVATGLKYTNPNIEIWIATGDGDSLSIGTNHFIHFLRRDIDANIILFNNKIYGLTKGQFSPTSPQGMISKSSPSGTSDLPLNPLLLSISSGASFIARSTDRHASLLQNTLIEAKKHIGSSLIEVLQNCPIFNDGIFDEYTRKDSQKNTTIILEEGKKMVFGAEFEKCIIWNNNMPKVANVKEVDENQIWIHSSENYIQALWLCHFGFEEFIYFPMPLGIIYKKNKDNFKKNSSIKITENQLFKIINKSSFSIK